MWITSLYRREISGYTQIMSTFLLFFRKTIVLCSTYTLFFLGRHILLFRSPVDKRLKLCITTMVFPCLHRKTVVSLCIKLCKQWKTL